MSRRKGSKNKKFVELGIDTKSTEWRGYKTQRNNANKRGIPFLLTFHEWVSIWQKSGKFALRGRRKGQYVMARKGDTGPYAIGNVNIILHSENSVLPHRGKKQSEKHKKAVAKSRKRWFDSLSAKDHAALCKALREGHRKKGGMKRIWQDPDYRERMLKIRRDTADNLSLKQHRTLRQLRKNDWDKLTSIERLARGRAISEGKRKAKALRAHKL